MDTIKVGDVEIIAVSDGYGDMDPLTAVSYTHLTLPTKA